MQPTQKKIAPAIFRDLFPCSGADGARYGFLPRTPDGTNELMGDVRYPPMDSHLSDNLHLKDAPIRYTKNIDAEERCGDSRNNITVAYGALENASVQEKDQLSDVKG